MPHIIRNKQTRLQPLSSTTSWPATDLALLDRCRCLTPLTGPDRVRRLPTLLTETLRRLERLEERLRPGRGVSKGGKFLGKFGSVHL